MKDTVNRLRRQIIDWEKYLQNTCLIKDLYLKYTKKILKYSNKKTKNAIKMDKYLNRHLTKGDIQMGNKHISRCSHHLSLGN